MSGCRIPRERAVRHADPDRRRIGLHDRLRKRFITITSGSSFRYTQASPWPATGVFGRHCSNARKSAKRGGIEDGGRGGGWDEERGMSVDAKERGDDCGKRMGTEKVRGGGQRRERGRKREAEGGGRGGMRAEERVRERAPRRVSRISCRTSDSPGPAGSSSRLPAPEAAESSTMPSYNRLRPNDCHRIKNGRREPI